MTTSLIAPTAARPTVHRRLLPLLWPWVGVLLATGVAACHGTPPPAKSSPSASASSAVAATVTPDRALPADIAATVAQLDQQLSAAWQQAGVIPSPRVDDSTFLRRAYLDIIGVPPSPAEVRRFGRDRAPDKRAKLVSRLVTSPAYAKHWTDHFAQQFMRALPGKQRRVDRAQFRHWLYAQLSSQRGWDELVRRLLTAKGINGRGGRRSPAAWALPDQPAAASGDINGAVNWLLAGASQPQNLAGATSRLFLGVQIQCAECHDHPTETWKQRDFQSFASALLFTQAKRLGKRKKMMGPPRFEVRDLTPGPRARKRRLRKVEFDENITPRALDGTPLDSQHSGKHPRVALADWITAASNPWFAKAFVNRMWAALLGRGFVDPIDDFRKDQEVEFAAGLQLLSEDFVKHGYDIRRLLRIIVASKAYQRSAAGKPLTSRAALWHRFALRPMSGTQLLDSVVSASQLGPVLEQVVGERLARVKQKLRREMTFTFDVDEPAGDDAFTGTVSQALMLLNGVLTSAGSTPLAGATVGEAVRSGGDDSAIIEQLYLAALSRKPAADEQKHWQAYVAKAAAAPARHIRTKGGGPVGRVYRRRKLRQLSATDDAYADVFWALLNSSEFFFIH
ncbi:MAG TPA: DUF1549 domain-containing protein [Sorangium sp.]|nr:DUF1549 domain-containing protein [Sorangium sp.]